jgi:hypothetical protein
LSRGQTERMSVLNDSVSHTREWRLELIPKRPGRLEIPSLVWGGQRSEPLAVEVVEDPAGGQAGAGSKPIFVVSEADHTTPYVQQAFHYRVKVLYSQAPQRAVLSEPEADGATIERDGEDRAFSEIIDGRRHQVIERRFLVVPQRSGPLVIRGPRLDAVLPEPRPPGRGAGNDFDALFGGVPFAGLSGLGGAGRRVLERAPDLALDVRPQPPGSDSPWLPAESVEISEEWIPSPPRLQAGEPVTRVLTVTARGTTAAQLPPLDLAVPDGAQMYPGQARTEDLPGVGAPVALKSLEVALVPTREGSLSLPEVRIPWWDTREDRERVAVVPARTLEVAPAAAETADASIEVLAPSTESAEDAPESRTRPANEAASRLTELLPGVSSGWFWPGLAGLLGLGWLATLALATRARRRDGARARADDRAPSRLLGAARRRVEQACLAGDARAARAALSAWGQVRWGGRTPMGLRALAERLGDAAAAKTLAQLDRVLYAGGDARSDPHAHAAISTGAGAGVTWDGAAAWSALAPCLSSGEASLESDPTAGLPDLYPRRV